MNCWLKNAMLNSNWTPFLGSKLRKRKIKKQFDVRGVNLFPKNWYKKIDTSFQHSKKISRIRFLEILPDLILEIARPEIRGTMVSTSSLLSSRGPQAMGRLRV